MIQENYSLREHNTFGLDISTKFFFEGRTQDELLMFIKDGYLEKGPFLIIGEGSNILFTRDFEGLVIHPLLKGIQIMQEQTDQIIVRVNAGENWDDFVKYTMDKGWGGIENLSYIPGSVGASPVQNIGAYGVEIKDRIISLEGINIPEKKPEIKLNRDCRFNYRNSIFKQELKNKFIITSVIFQLDRNPKLIVDYDIVRREFEKKKDKNPFTLRQTILEIRSKKLPDPEKYGNAGSFFKNPMIDLHLYNKLKEKYSDLPSYPAGHNEYVKIPAAWLIECAGFKGVREGNTGSYPLQPLVIINYGEASGKEILDFSEKIKQSVRNIFGIELEREVNII